MSDLRLTYAFTPTSIDTSDTVNVSVLMAPPDGATIALSSIELKIFTGGTSNALAAALPTPQVDPGWSVTPSNGVLVLTPPSQGISVACALTFQGVLVNDQPGTVAVQVYENPPVGEGATATLRGWQKRLPANKFVSGLWVDPPVLPDRDLPVTMTWAAAGTQSDLAFQLTVDPVVALSPSCPCTPGQDNCYDWGDGTTGVTCLTIQQFSTFTLTAYVPTGGGDRTQVQQLTAHVYVETPRIPMFNSDPFLGGRINRMQWLALGSIDCALTVDGPPGTPVPTDTHDLPWLVPVGPGTHAVTLTATNGTASNSSFETVVADAASQPGVVFDPAVEVLAAATSADGAISAVLTGLAQSESGTGWTVALTVVTADGSTGGIQLSGGQNPATARWSLDMTSDGSTVVIGGPCSDTAWSYSTSGSPLRQLCHQAMLAVALVDDSTVVALCADGTLQVIDLETGSTTSCVISDGGFFEPQLVVLSDGSAAVITDVTGWIGCVRLADQSLLWSAGVASGPAVLAVTEDGHFLVALGDQVTVASVTDGPAGTMAVVTMPGAVADLVALTSSSSAAIKDCPFGLALAGVQGPAAGVYVVDAAAVGSSGRDVLLADPLDLDGATPTALAVAADGYHALMVAGTPPTVSFLATPPTQQLPAPTNLVTGQFVCSGSGLSSPDGQYTARLDTTAGLSLDGPLGHPYWQVQPGAAEAAYFMILGTDGQLTISCGTGPHDTVSDIWASASTGDDPDNAYVLALGDDGSLMVNQVSTNWNGSQVPFVWRGDLLFPGQQLWDEQWLVSPSGTYRAHSWNDGVLALEKSTSTVTGPGGVLVNTQKTTWAMASAWWREPENPAGNKGWIISIDAGTGVITMTCEGDTPWLATPTSQGVGAFFVSATDLGYLVTRQGTQAANTIVWISR